MLTVVSVRLLCVDSGLCETGVLTVVSVRLVCVDSGQYETVVSMRLVCVDSGQCCRRKKDKESGVARGIDFHNIANVINFDFPLNPDAYVHRVGR